MLLKNNNELRYSAGKPLKMFRKEQYKCLCRKTEDLAQKKCRKSAGNGPEIYKNQKFRKITRDGRMDGLANGRTGKWTEGWLDGWTVGQTDRLMDQRSLVDTRSLI